MPVGFRGYYGEMDHGFKDIFKTVWKGRRRFSESDYHNWWDMALLLWSRNKAALASVEVEWFVPSKEGKDVQIQGKHMFIVFFGIKGVILSHAVPKGQSVNSMYYLKVLCRYLMRSLARKWPGGYDGGFICIRTMLPPMHHRKCKPQ